MIENIELLAFVRENLALARTIVIKNEDLAILDNANMLKYSDIDSGTDKSKWRYYLNLNGEYHFTDEIMIVKSLDDNELIDFTKKNLEDHPATKKAYRLGGYYFSRLVAQYPHQMELIQGIINPIPPEESIPAKNYQILRYTKEYIEWNEFQLIPKLQDFINQTVYQSFNTEYKDTDDLLLPVLIAHLSEGIYKFLLECRFEHRYSRNAHSFYIWSFLQSKGISPIYKDLLNNKQTMWLFRNIDYVLRNLGKSGTFKELIEILLTERNIPLAKYDLIQSTESMAKDLHSEPLFFSERLNLIETRGLGQQTNKIARTMLKEIPESLDNEIYYDKFLPVTTAESTYGDQTTYPTKILDSELVDTTNRKPETIYNLLNNELIYLAGNGLYNINLDIEDPLSGIHQRISVKDAIVLWHHLLNKFNGADCDSIPSFYYREVLKITPPTIETMQSVGAKPFLNENWCRDVLNTYIPQIRMVSPSVFYENALAVFNLKWDHVKMYSRWLSIGYYSRRKNAISTMYETGFIKLTDKKTYSEFLEQYDFDFSSYNKEDYFSLMWEIWRKMTGWDQFSHITIGQIQDGMIGLMKFLSSYSVQYIHQTTMEEGWYEGGLDLMTENPGLLHPDGDGQLELETDVESNRIPIHHRVVMTAEEEETLYLDNRLDHGTIEAEMAMTAEVFETPNLYNVELDDTDKDDGFHSSQVMDFDHKLRLFTGKLPYELEDLIPDGGTRAGDHTLKEMIVDSFDGIQQVGPWKAKGIWIVNNKGLDNQAVAEDVDGYDYAKIVDVKEVKKDGETYNRYYVGFVPALIGENVIKLDIVAEHEDSGESMHVRFDYNIESKKNTWALSLEIPESVQLNTPFPITPTITGLTLTGLEIVKEQYSVHADIAEYIEIDDKDGVVSGTFLKKGWPEILPVMYTLLVSNGDEDELLSRHYYYMLGYVPSDRYYDPLTDPEFEPKGTYFEGDTNALTLERFTLTASNKGWEPVEISLKMNEDGSYPTNLVKTDYEGIVNFLAPRTIKYEDAEIKGKTVRTFEWLYGAAATGITIPLVLKLQNTEGEVVYRDFEYKPEIINHGINASFDIYPESGFKFGIKHSTTTKLTVDGLPDTVTLLSGGVPTGFPNQGSVIEIDYDPEQGVENNVALGYSVRPQSLIEQDFRWAIQVEATTKARNGRDLTIKPYGMFTIPQSDVVDYDTIDIKDIRIKGWENSTIRAHAIVPSRYSISDLSNGWQLEGIEITKTNGYYPEFVGKELPGVNASNGITGFSPVIKMGVGTDGAQTVPAGYDRWFTIYMLGNRDYLGEGYQELDIPVTATMKSKYTGNTKVVQLTLKNGFSGQAFASTRNPDEIVASTNNHILPSWKNLPLRDFGDDATLISSEGLFIGADKYLGGAGYKEQTECIWNSDQTANIILPTAPISDGQGIKIYNKRIYKSNDARFANSSVEEVVYYPFVEYSKSEIIRVPPPTLEDFDFTNLDNVEFFQGVRSSYVTLYNAAKVYEKGWTVKSVDLEILGTDEQDNYIQTSINGKDLKSNMYTSGAQNNSVHDAPTGKTKYAAAYVGFVPVLTGKQKFGVIVTVACNSISIPTRSYRYEIEIDVQEREGEIIFDTSYPDPWWLLGKETFVLTELKGYTGNVSQKRMLLGTINDEDKQYASVRAAVNASLSSGIALAVTVPDRFTGVTPKAIVGHSIFLNGYLTADARRTRYYFGTLPIRSDRLYNIDEINLETIEFTPDVVFDSMDVNQSYTERYMYNINTRGWYINTIRVQDESDWMNHYFEYGEKLVTDSSLFNVSAQNVTKDKTITAPTGKTYYLPMYGSRKIGNFSVKINILLSNKHHSSNAGINLVYEADREIVESNIKLNLGYEAIYIGKNNLLTGDFEGIPTSDIHEGMVANVSKYSVIAEKDSYFQFSANPYAVDVKSGYPEGSGSGIKLTASVVYGNVAPNKVLESATWIRGYRGEQFISEDSIIKPINYPAIEDFDFTLFKSNLIQGASSCLLYAYKPLGRSDEGWVSSDIGLSVYGTPDESEVMIRKIGDYDIPETYVHTVITGPSGIRLPELPDDKPYAEYANHSLRFIPAKSGKQKLEIVFTVRSTSNPKIPSKQYVFPIEVDVAENGAYVGRKPGTEDIKLLIGDTTKVEVALVGNVPDAVTSSRSVKATPVGENINDYIFTTNYDTFISTSIVKGFDDTKNIAMIMQSTFKDVDGIFISNDQRATVYYINMLPIEPALLYSLDEINAGFINFIPEITTPVMARNQSYCERFIYDAESRGWSVTEMRLVPDNSWMNHYFEYEGVSTTNAQLLSQGNARIRYDRNITAPDGKYYFLPFYGGRTEGEFTVGVNVTVTNSVHTKNKRYTFRIEFDRKIVEEGIGLTLSYDKLYLGETVGYQQSYTNVPTSDLKTGVISSNTLYKILGPDASHFKMDTSKGTITVDNSYPLGDGKGALVTIVRPYKATRAGNNIDSETYFRAYRTEYLIPDSDIDIRPDAFGIVSGDNEIMTGVVCGERFYFNDPSSLPGGGWTVDSIDIKGMKDGTYDKSKFIKEVEGFTSASIYNSRPSSKKDWNINGRSKNAFVVQFVLREFTGEIVNGVENRDVTIPMVLTASRGGRTFEFEFDYVAKDVAKGKTPEFSLSANNYNFWPVNFNGEKRTILNVNNLPGRYLKKKIGYIRPYGDNADKTKVSTLNQGSLDGAANTIFRFSDMSDKDFEYVVMTSHYLSTDYDPDVEVQIRGFFGIFTIPSFRVQDYDSWDLKNFAFSYDQFRPMFVDEYGVLGLKSIGYVDGLGINEIEIVSFSDDIAVTDLTVDGVTISAPMQPNYLLNVNKDGIRRLSTSPGGAFVFLGFMPKYAGEFSVKLRIKYVVGYSTYTREEVIDVPIRVMESRVRLNLIGDKYWANTDKKDYNIRTHRVPVPARDNVSLVNQTVGIFSESGTKVEITSTQNLSVTPDAASLTKPLEFFIFNEYTDLNMTNTPAQKAGVLLRYRFNNNGYDWVAGSVGAGNAGRSFVNSNFWLTKDGQNSQDQENAAAVPGRHIINGINHSVSYGGGTVVNGRRTRQYVTGYVPECYLDLQAVGSTKVAGLPVNLFTQAEVVTFSQKQSLRCRSMYLNEKGNLMMEFAYHDGTNAESWKPLPDNAKFTSQSWKVNSSAVTTSPMVEMTLANMSVENIANVGILTLEFEKPDGIPKFIFNAKLTIDSILNIILDDGTSVDLQIRVEEGFLSW